MRQPDRSNWLAENGHQVSYLTIQHARAILTAEEPRLGRPKSLPDRYGFGYALGPPAAKDWFDETQANGLCAETQAVANPLGASDFLWQWGQFLDHDIDLTEAQDPEEPVPIPVPTGDPWFDPTSSGIALNRSVYHHGTGHDPAYPRQQLNQITHFIDASNVYGSDDVRAAAIMGVAILVHLIWVVSVDGDGLFRYRFYVPIVGSVASERSPFLFEFS